MPLTQIDPALLAPAAQYTGFKNRIINGAMMIDQRNAGASGTGNDNYTVDRWAYFGTQASKGTWQQSTTAPAGFTNSLGFTSSSAYSVLSSDSFIFTQKIEGFNVADLAWGTADAQPVTLSFRVRSSLTGTFGGCVQNANGTRNYVFSYTISAANTWETKTITITGDTTGTWLTTNGIGMRLYIGLGVGSTYSRTEGSWGAGDVRSVTGATSVVGTNGATFYITGVQLEKGSTATSFDYRPYGTELALCQRYYWQTQQGIYMWGNNVTNGQLYQFVPFPVFMRTTPTISNNWTTSTTIGSIQSSSAHGMNLGLAATVGNNFSATYNIGNTISAEL